MEGGVLHYGKPVGGGHSLLCYYSFLHMVSPVVRGSPHHHTHCMIINQVKLGLDFISRCQLTFSATNIH